MFGYVVTNQEELKLREFREYRRYYCGLCHSLKKRYGVKGQISVNYDMTFLALLLSSLYEPAERREKSRCVVHPVVPQTYVTSEILDYAADMNILLMYYKCMDDWRDEHKCLRLVYAKLLGAGGRELPAKYERQIRAVVSTLKKLSREEQAGQKNVDLTADLFGSAMGEIFCMKQDIWQEELRRIGYYLGKFIYLADALDDYEKDKKREDYNPLQSIFTDMGEEEGRQWAMTVLTLYASECAAHFERLPLEQNVELLRNILYAGIWSFKAKTEKPLKGEKTANWEKEV